MVAQIMCCFDDGNKLGVSIEYYVEDQSSGNAGALFKLCPILREELFLLLNANAVFDVDFNRFVEFYKSHGGLVTLFNHPNNHPCDYNRCRWKCREMAHKRGCETKVAPKPRECRSACN